MILKKRVLIFFVLLSIAAYGQTSDPARLDLKRIFSSGEFSPRGIGVVRWLAPGDAYSKLEASTTLKGGTDLVKYDAATGKRDILISAERLVPSGSTTALPIHGYDWSDDGSKILIFTNSQRVWRLNTKGDYWVLDLPTGKLQKLGGDAKPATLMFAKFSPAADRIAYVRENDIYVERLSDGTITRLTKDGSPTLSNGTSDWVNEEEFSLRDCWRWSPDGRSIAFWQFDASGIKDFLLINNTSELYPTITKLPYPKAGTTNAAVRAGVINADGGEPIWLKVPGDPRNQYIVMVEWAGNSNEIILQEINRAQNTARVMFADPKSGAVRTILTEKDDAWVDDDSSDLRWLGKGERFLWVSERDGWRHVYQVSRDGSSTKLITPGKFDVVSIQSIDESGGWIYYIASPDNPTQRYLFRSKLDGTGTPERITPAGRSGWNSYNISPNSRWAINTFSSFGNVPNTDLIDLSTKAKVRSMADNSAVQAKIDKISKGQHEFQKVDIGQGVVLDAWVMKPPGFDPTKKYPILYYVYGEPASQTVIDNWGGSRYLWHLMLTQQGYIVASVDNRGTPAPKGRDWRKSVYRKIGLLTSQDQAAAVKAMLAKMPYIDPGKVAVWGWSGGGSSTLNAMFRYPDLYKVGMSVAPVADMRYYDTIYQERYMGLPQDAADDYKNGSPISFANGLKGDLLIVHGTGDDNVHYQATELLINELIKLNKPFSMMAYPNRSHGIFEGENTTLHLHGLLTKYLRDHLPAESTGEIVP